MGLDAQLLQQGYTLPGTPNNTGVKLLGGLVEGLQGFMTARKLKEQDRQKKLEEQASTYKTLRDAGYTPTKAHDAVLSGDLPKDVPGTTTAEQKSAADLEQTQANTAKIKKETEVLGDKKATIESRILNKIANSEQLSEGEQKIYDDVIKKKNQSSLADLLAGGGDASAADGTPDTATVKPAVTASKGDPLVPVISPDGKNGYVKQSKLDAAVKKGYKKR